LDVKFFKAKIYLSQKDQIHFRYPFSILRNKIRILGSKQGIM